MQPENNQRLFRSANFNRETANQVVKKRGYSLVEVLLVMVVVTMVAGLIIVKAAIHFGPSLFTPDIELATTQVFRTVIGARDAAMMGNPDPHTRQVDIIKAVANKYPAVSFDITLSGSTANCQCGRSSRQTNQPAPPQLCVSGADFCYVPSSQFEFERFTGQMKNDESHAIFLSNSSRKLAVLVWGNGKVQVMELINGQWQTTEDLQSLDE